MRVISTLRFAIRPLHGGAGCIPRRAQLPKKRPAWPQAETASSRSSWIRCGTRSPPASRREHDARDRTRRCHRQRAARAALCWLRRASVPLADHRSLVTELVAEGFEGGFRFGLGRAADPVQLELHPTWPAQSGRNTPIPEGSAPWAAKQRLFVQLYRSRPTIENGSARTTRLCTDAGHYSPLAGDTRPGPAAFMASTNGAALMPYQAQAA